MAPLEEASLARVVDDRYASAGPEVGPDGLEVGGAVLEMMVGVAGEQEVHGLGKLRIATGREHRLDVGVPVLRGLLAHVLEHALVDVDRVDLPVRSDRLCDQEGEVAAARPEVADARAGREGEALDDAIRFLPFVAVAEVLVGEPLEVGAPAEECLRSLYGVD